MIAPILTYNSEDWGAFVKSGFKSWDSSAIEKTHDLKMEIAGVRYLRMRFWRIKNVTRSLRLLFRFLIQKRVRKYRTKYFPCGIVFIIYILRHSSFWHSFYFKSFQNAKIAATPREMTTKSKY